MNETTQKPHGGCHWLFERITSIALVPLTLWAVYSAVSLRGASHEEFTAWLQSPLNAGLVILLLVIGLVHGVMGGQVIAEDYIANVCFRRLKIIGMRVFFGLLGLTSIAAVISVVLN